MKKITFLLLLIVLSINVLATDYYIDYTNGDNANNGTSPDYAWKTLRNAFGSVLQAGDNLYLKRGEVWEYDDYWKEYLYISNSGNETHPITIDAYGTGDKPIVEQIVNITDWNQPTSWTEQISNVWYIDYSSSPHRLWIDDYEYEWVATFSEITSTKRVSFDETNNRLYVYATSNPSSFYSTMRTIRGAKAWSLYLNGVSYINVYNIVLSGGQNAAIEFVNVNNINFMYNDVIKTYNGMIIDEGGIATDEQYNIEIAYNNFDSEYNQVNTLTYPNGAAQDAILLYEGSHDNHIHHNFFNGWGHSAINVHGLSSTYTPNENNLIEYNNFTLSPLMTYGRAMDMTGIDGYCNNNTWNGNYAYNMYTRSQYTGSNFKIINNLYVNHTTSPRKPTKDIGQAINVEIYTVNGGAFNVTIANNTIENTDSACIQLESGSGTKIQGVTIKNNVLKDCGQQYISGISQSNVSIAIDLTNKINNNTINNNLIYGNDAIYYRGNVYNTDEFNNLDTSENDDLTFNNFVDDPDLNSDYEVNSEQSCYGSDVNSYVGGRGCYCKSEVPISYTLICNFLTCTFQSTWCREENPNTSPSITCDYTGCY